MANFFYSVGYSAENVHSGIIAHLCDLWNDGEKEPLRSFLDRLGVPLGDPSRLRVNREWKRIDLVIRDAEDNSTVFAIEMKVDSHEGLVKGVPQTIAYPRLLPGGTPLLFVTLGAGEFYHAPHGEQTRWIRLRAFHEALKTISTDDRLIGAYREAVNNEVDLQDRCFAGNRSRIGEHRGRTWNLYLLGHLKEKLIEALSGRDIGIDPFVYPYGSGPDTILYFGRSKLPAYLEINQDGRLNLKVYLGDLGTDERSKRERAQKAQDHYRELLGDHNPTQKRVKMNSSVKGKSVMSFDVGLERQNGDLSLRAEDSETVDRLSGVLEKFYGEPPFDNVDIDPSVHPPYF